MAALVRPLDLADAMGLVDTAVSDPETLEVLESVCDAASDFLYSYLKKGIVHDNHPGCREAALAIAVELFQGRTAAGGIPVSMDFQPSPWRRGRSLLNVVAGLISPCRNVKTMAV